ncbi:o-succinylbenzoate synthase [Allomuricauda sp. d1]|uniref:o-succinylbenzoate synthase n=1 Tax=Allomuricauda sp. d1 TaxID=3136725 RepID=UPI0031D2DC25
MKAQYKKYILNFKRPSGTSRGVLTQKETWFLILNENGNFGIGECGLLRGLSCDDLDAYEEKLRWVCENIHLGESVLLEALKRFPSIQFGLEQAFLSLKAKNPFELFSSDFVENEAPIPINGLIWMGDEQFMLEQIDQKLQEGFSCLKMKIGALDFGKELAVLKSIRKRFSAKEIELRVDANGGFGLDHAALKLKKLSELDIHSIEQPIKPNNWQVMSTLCKTSDIPIALDEELIGVFDVTKKAELLQTIQPQYVILKPSLLGGIHGCNEWIALADSNRIGWWVTSALESNIGLNAIAQFTYALNSTMPQGLGTGSLFVNNFQSPLEVEQGKLFYRKDLSWQDDLIQSLCT